MVLGFSKKTAIIVYSNLVPRALYPAKEKVSGHEVGSTVPNFSNECYDNRVLSMKEIGPRGGASPYKTLLRSTPGSHTQRNCSENVLSKTILSELRRHVSFAGLKKNISFQYATCTSSIMHLI